MDLTSELVRIVGGRREGWWGLVATALGDEEACQRTKAALSRQALSTGYEGAASSPTIVEHRVQALAAHDQRVLVRLSRDWKQVTEIGQSLMDPEVDFWTAAWQTSLRFLKSLGEISDIRARALPRALAREFDVLFRPKAPTRIRSWEEARNTLLAAEDYDEIRQLDASETAFDDQIGKTELEHLLRPDQRGEPRMELLRFFFGRGQLIDEGGRHYLEDMVEAHWLSLHELGTTPSGFTILVDLVFELQGPQKPERKLYPSLLSSLETLETPERLLPIVYLALGKGWRHS